MFRYGLLLTALATTLLVTFVLHRTGWFDPKTAHAGREVHAHTADALKVPAVVRYRQGQMKHWRALLLQH